MHVKYIKTFTENIQRSRLFMKSIPLITVLGAGSTIFLKNLIGDVLLLDALRDIRINLYDIDAVRLKESYQVITSLNNTLNGNRAEIEIYHGKAERKEALKNADFVINTIQIGGYEPATVTDFSLPDKFGLRQTIGDTIGIGGIFRGLRTIPVMMEIVTEMEEVCPEALLLNYANPMAIVVGAIQKSSFISSVGLCHSVQVCVPHLLESLGISAENPKWKIRGINHMAWLLEIHDGKRDLYPEIKKRAAEKNLREKHDDMVRFEMMKYFGYYTTESSEHFAEYTPYWIRKDAPELINDYNIPLNEYPRRCVQQIEEWNVRKEELLKGASLSHEKTHEYGADIISAVVTDTPFRFHGNLLNAPGYISNLSREAVVEIPCLADRNGVQGVFAGALPPQCAALNMTNINVHRMTIEAALTRSRDAVYQAALLDPHTSAELPPHKILSLCDLLLEGHKEWLPEYR